MQNMHSVVIDTHVRVGSRFEHADNNGISHVLEHMLYRGVNRYPSAHEQALAFERLGGTLVAATYVDHGTLSIAVPAESVEETLALFAEVFQAPLLDALELEKGIIREEILEGLDDAGRRVNADDLARELAFGDHPLGMPITGTLEGIEHFERSELRRHHRRHYTACNTTVSVTGAVDPHHVLRAVEKRFGALPAGRIPRAVTPAPQSTPRFGYVRHRSSQTALRMAFRAPGDHDPAEPAVDMLLRIVDDGMSTRLYHRICDARGLCYEVSAGYEAYTDAGVFDFAAETAHERADAVLAELIALVSELAEHGPTEDELDKARARCAWQHQDLLDSPEDVAAFHGLSGISGIRRTPRGRLAELEGVTAEQVRAAAEHVFQKAGLTVVAVGLLGARAQSSLLRRVDRFGQR
jgi:predicted Zn-dependent peptidase